MSKADRDLGKLNPNFRKKVDEFLRIVAPKYGVFITEAWRSDARQKELFAQGLSKTKRSKHQDGLAIDIAFLGKELYPIEIKRWEEVAKIAKECGMNWGYDMWGWDKPHFEDNGKNFSNPMTEEEKKAIQAVMAVNSSAWFALKNFPEIQEKLAEVNKKFSVFCRDEN